MSFALTQRLRMPRYSDIPDLSAVQGEKPKRAILILPHTAEHPATVPVSKELGEILRSEGTMVEEKRVNDMMERGWRARIAIGPEDNDAFHFKEGFAHVLRLQDRLIRSELIWNSVVHYGEAAFVLELHAMNDYSLNDVCSASDVEGFFKLKDSKLHVLKDLVGNLTKKDGIAPESIKMAKKIASSLGFDLQEAEEKLTWLKKKLAPFKKVVQLVEIPSKQCSYEGNEPLFKEYMAAVDKTDMGFTRFEEAYFNVLRMPIYGAGPDAFQIASIVKMPYGFKVNLSSCW